MNHVREILYDLGEDLQTEDAYEHRSLVKHFEYLHNGVNSLLELDWQYEISLSETETFNLTIDSIHLNMYRTGVGMLVFHLRNFVYSSPEDILKINQYGRRLYPPFYVLGKQSVIDGLKDEILEPEGLEKSKGEEIPNSIAIKNKEKYLFKESYGSYSDLKNVANGPFLIPKFISGLFPDNFLCEHACEAVNGHYVASLLEDIKENGEEDIKIAATKYLEKQETDLHIKGQNKTSLFVTQVFEGKKEVSGELENIAPNLRDIFFDAFPVEVNNKQQQLLGDDFITPHHPDDPVTGQFKNPIPICFLKIMPKVVFQFNFKLGDEGMDKALKKELFRQIILDQGIGAKTNVGYGNFTTDNGQGNN